ncbi:protocatechuate 3,4-dioxygenase subunit beta [Nocardioides sp. BP30]|uniref:protocatechuate 3,4-dioxygenase subunit beta n=1 Tax=Nocardioides sp. BP30 TaxID=3036374 RepID=UPI002469A633|nr:protocatechuate 3,4-dioxygenase subunit beta [Nocardioides sp. BP30]WGL52213.1 protocatechuate 3,4-dioxygenase subunit beta [Nocardioides sp. BP30]
MSTTPRTDAAQETAVPSSDAAATTQAEISAEIAEIDAQQQPGGAQPRIDYPPYRSSILRHPTKDPRHADPETIERWAPVFGQRDVHKLESDLTLGAHAGTNSEVWGEPIGERITVSGRIVDGEGRPVAGQLVEIWQANAAGRYVHKNEQHPAPLDPNFTGVGRCLTNENGEYWFRTIKPGPYPWGNHRNAWRPAHIHFSLFGNQFTERLVTQMYFPGDPLFALDPIYQAITDQRARDALLATYDHDLTVPEYSMGYRWDIVLSGRDRTWMEPEEADQ